MQHVLQVHNSLPLATGRCPNRNTSSLQSHSLHFWDTFWFYMTNNAWFFQDVSFHQLFWPTFCIHFTSPSFIQHPPPQPTWFDYCNILCSVPKNYITPHYAIMLGLPPLPCTLKYTATANFAICTLDSPDTY